MFATQILIVLLIACVIYSRGRTYCGDVSFTTDTTRPLRGLLILLIVAHHLAQSTEIPGLSSSLSDIGKPLVAVFFFLSGYGLCVSFSIKGESYLQGFFGKRLGKLLPKFLLLTAVAMIFVHFYGGYSAGEQLSALFSKGDTPLPFSWFIYVILYVYISFFICARIGKTPRLTGWLFLGAILMYFVICGKVLKFPAHWWHTVLSVNLGYFTALYEKNISRAISKSRMIAYITLVLALAGLEWLKNHYPAHIAMLSLVGLLLFDALAVYVIVRCMGMKRWRWLEFAGIYSFDIYLVHGIVLRISQHAGLDGYLLWGMTYLGAIIMAVAINRAFGYPWLRRMSLTKPS